MVEKSNEKEAAAGKKTPKNKKPKHFAELLFNFKHVELQQHLNILRLCECSCRGEVGAEDGVRAGAELLGINSELGISAFARSDGPAVLGVCRNRGEEPWKAWNSLPPSPDAQVFLLVLPPQIHQVSASSTGSSGFAK